jgi:hypothetical protein
LTESVIESTAPIDGPLPGGPGHGPSADGRCRSIQAAAPRARQRWEAAAGRVG